MKTSQLAILAGVTIVVGGLAYWSQQRTTPVLSATSTQGPLLPGLSEKINDITLISLKKGKDTTTLRKVNGDWTIEEKSGYPALFENVKQLAINLAALERFEAKSNKPEHYKVLGVADPAPDNEVAAAVDLKSTDNASIASLIIGGTRGGFGNAPAEATVRIPGDPQVWQVRGTAVINADPLSWLQRNIIEVARDRVKRVTVTPSVSVETAPVGPSASAGSQLVITRAAADTPSFSVADIPAGRELSSPTAADGIGAALSYVSLDDVKPASFVKDLAPVGTAEFQTFDGLVVKTTTYKKDAGWYVTFSAIFQEPAPADQPAESKTDAQKDAKSDTKSAAVTKSRDEVNKEVAQINSKLGGWAFMLPEFKAKQLCGGMQDVLKPLETPKEPTAAGPMPPDAPTPPAVVPPQ